MPTLFEKIVAGEIPANIVHQDDRVTAFRDISPQAPVHVLIVPNKPIPTVNDVSEDDEWSLVNEVEIPGSSEVYAIATTVNIVDGDGVPAEGDNLDQALLFAPDGSAEPRTVYLRSYDQRKENRVVVYRATGTAMRKDTW
jgi:hypothetical protein